MPRVFVLVGAALAIVVAGALWRWWSAHVGRKLRCKGGAIYYWPPAKADEAQKLGAFLERGDYFTTTQSTAALRKEAGTYQFCVPGAEDIYQDEEALAKCAVVGAGLSDEVFAGDAVEVHLWDVRLRTLAVVPHRGKFGERLRFNAAEVFHTSGVSES